MPRHNKKVNLDTKKKIFALYNNRCVHCGDKFPVKKLTRDHIIPASRGGQWDWKNLVPSCQPCNESRSNNLLEPWREEELRKLAMKNFCVFYFNPERLAVNKVRCEEQFQKRQKRRTEEM